MAMLKTLVRKAGGCRQARNYLEKDGRALTVDCSGDVDPERWDEDFDAVRRAWGKDEGRRYYHFIVSPDPKDGIDADGARELALAWVAARYPDAQWSVVTHEDNGIPHAHIVVNSVLPATGRKVHISDAEVRVDAMELQRLCKERGLSAFDTFDIVMDEHGDWVAKSRIPLRDVEHARLRGRGAGRARRSSQEWLRAKGVHLWTDDARDAVEEALEGCRTWAAFERALAEKGYGARVSRRGVLTIYPPEGAGHPVKGYKLDDSYTVEGIRARLKASLDRRAAAGTIAALPGSDVRLPRTFAEAVESQARRYRARGGALRELEGALDAVSIAKENGFTSYRQLADAARDIRARADAVAERLDEARLAHEQMDTASRKVIEREALANRMGSRPRGPLAASRWERDFAREIEVAAEIDEWLAERGLPPTVALADVQRMREEAYREVAALAGEAERLSEGAERVERAARAVGAMGTLAKYEAPGLRAAESGAAAAQPLREVMTADEYAEFSRRALEAAARRGRIVFSAWATEEQMALMAAADAERRVSGRSGAAEGPSRGKGRRGGRVEMARRGEEAREGARDGRGEDGQRRMHPSEGVRR